MYACVCISVCAYQCVSESMLVCAWAGGRVACLTLIKLFSHQSLCSTLYMYIVCRWFESHPRQLIFLWKVTALGVLCCFALFI